MTSKIGLASSGHASHGGVGGRLEPGRPDGALPHHVEQSVQAIASLHCDHHRDASATHRLADRMVRFACRPCFAGVLTALLVTWIGGNLVVAAIGGKPLDPPPFQWLQVAAAILALYVTVLVLLTQRREYQLDERRARFTLQLALLAEQKNAKIIGMLEEMRRDHPEMKNRIDREASAMAVPANSDAILSAIESAHSTWN